MENFKPPVPVEWSAQRVLTTAQLAEEYGCEVHNIKKNFNQNKLRFVEGTHYFKLTGKDLENLRVTISDLQNLRVTDGDLQISPKTRTLYLWTARGAARHAKMLSTDKAWEVYEKLEDFYFSFKQSKVAPVPAPAKNARSEAQKRAAVVYVLLLSNGLIKIGHSGKICARIAEIKRETKSTVEKIYTSLLMPRDIARQIERLCLENFSSRRVEGEIFSVSFEEVCAAVDIFAKNLYALPQFMNFIVTLNKKIVDKKLN